MVKFPLQNRIDSAAHFLIITIMHGTQAVPLNIDV